MKIKATSVPELHVVLAYGNLSAACRATECLNTKLRTGFAERPMRLSAWSFDMLETPRLFAQAVGRVGQAHFLAIAVGEAKRPLPGVTERWLKTCLARRHQAQLTVATISGEYEIQPDAAIPWFESVQRVVVGAGCAFLAWQVAGTADFLV
jgi:hypothetical protein